MKLDLCCNTRKPDGYIGIDIEQFPGVDRVWDLNKCIPFSDNSIDEIRAYDALEHLKDGIRIMKECWRVLKPGGLLDILVPSTDGRGAWQDQTHCSYWNENSFDYWINTAPFLDYYRGECLFEYGHIQTTPMSENMVCHVEVKIYTVKAEWWLQQYEGRNKK